MGLNLDLDHVAFAQNRKFDGYQYRDLSAAELGQIAGRAGRHLRDGTFGVTGQVDPFDDELVEKIEGHDFDPVKVLQWRTAGFDFSSLDALQRSIETPAPVEGLTRALPAVDAQALEHLSRDPDIRDLAIGRERVALLWEVCALPDYRKIAPAQHADLIASIYDDLATAGPCRRELHGRAGAPRRFDRRRYRRAVAPHRADPHLDLRVQPARLACRSGTLAGKDARNRGQTVGCAA